MTVMMREKDVELTEVLHDCLKDYLAEPLPKEHLNKTLSILISEIRKRSRKSEEKIFVDNDLYWDSDRKQLVYKQSVISLTKKERELLTLLFSDVSRDFSYDVILTRLWGEISPSKQDSLKTLVKQLRKKLPYNIVKNIFGFGYKIEIKQ
jgi:DNA-binding response OmpR family regulator